MFSGAEAWATDYAQCVWNGERGAMILCMDKLENPVAYSLCVAFGTATAPMICQA